MTVQDRLERALVRVMGPLREELTPTANLSIDLEMDSLDFVELVMEIEQTFKVAVSEAEGDKLRTWGDVMKLVDKLVEAQRRAAIPPPQESQQSAVAGG